MSAWYARRAVAWLPLLVYSAVGALLGAIEVTIGSGWQAAGYALLGLVPASGCLIDEPAARTVDSAAATLRWRTLARVWGLLLPGGVFLVMVAGVAGRPEAPVVLMLVDGWVLMGVAFAATVGLRRTGQETPSRLVAPAAVLVLTIALLFSGRVPAALQPLNVESHAPWLRLAILALVALVMVGLGTRDLVVGRLGPGRDWSPRFLLRGGPPP